MEQAKNTASAKGSSGAEAAFARLRELYDRLPAMEERGERLARARAAAEVARREAELATARALLSEAEAREVEAREAFEQVAAGVACHGAEAEERRRALLHAGSLRGFRIGPAQNAEAALARALAEGPFASAAEAREAALGEGELAALEAEVEAYRRAYADALACCERLEASIS